MRARFDSNWKRNALRGDARAFEFLTDEMLQPLFGFCFNRVGRRRHICEEVVQETFLRAVLDLEKYDPARCENDIFPWLTSLARNEIRKALGEEESFSMNMDEQLMAAFLQIETRLLGDEALRRPETRELVDATMNKLPASHREVLIGKYVRGLSVRELASASSATEKTVESMLSRARAEFRSVFLALSNGYGTPRSTRQEGVRP